MKSLMTRLLMISGALGATVKLAWNANPVEQAVVAYDVKAWEVFGTQEVVVQAVTPTAEVPGLKAGVNYFFAVRARNAAGVASAYSAAIMAAPVARMRVVMQVSSDMSDWSDVSETMRVMESREFFRVKMEVVE